MALYRQILSSVGRFRIHAVCTNAWSSQNRVYRVQLFINFYCGLVTRLDLSFWKWIFGYNVFVIYTYVF